MVIIDTNILIDIFRNNKETIKKCKELGISNLVLTPICVVEFWQGAQNKEAAIPFEKFLGIYEVLDLQPEIGTIFINIYKKYCLSHRPQISDIMIAAFAIHYQIPLYTLNRKHFEFIEGLQLV